MIIPEAAFYMVGTIEEALRKVKKNEKIKFFLALKLEIISPDKLIFNEEVDMVFLPGIEGDFGILEKHMPFLTTLRLGIAYIYKKKNY